MIGRIGGNVQFRRIFFCSKAILSNEHGSEMADSSNSYHNRTRNGDVELNEHERACGFIPPKSPTSKLFA